MFQLNGVNKGSCPLCEGNQKEKPLFSIHHPLLSADVCSFHLERLVGLMKKPEKPEQKIPVAQLPPRVNAEVKAS